MAQVAVLPAFKNSKQSKLVALVSGDKTKLKELGKRYGVTQLYSYDDYDRCLRSGEIDAVYIALPNTMHESYAVRAAEAGIHVLCEKPLSVVPAESERMIRAAKLAEIRFMAAYRLHFDPANLKAIEMIHSGKIGEPHYFTSEFSYVLKSDNIRARGDEGGSPLHDIGIYCINAARYLFKSEPTEVFAMAVNTDPRLKDIDQTVSATLKFPQNRIAQFTCSFASAPRSSYRVVCAKGDVHLENAYEYVGEVTTTITRNEKKQVIKSKPGDQFAAELEYFSQCVKSGRDPEPSGEHGLVDVQIIEALHRSIDSGKTVSLKNNLPKIKSRPTLRMKIKRPSHREPKLIGVEAASK
ncbi:MAG: Gfo/Idh/MocA family oxidoreductase [Proteobacteria bacterium]|nr:MAG: Gfo/Idh/MocA family oxidoreductase [Pseudomonadota bacterium]